MPYQTYLTTASDPRSRVYAHVFRTKSDEETCGAMLWSQAMSAALTTLISNFEVALRNRIHVSLSRQASAQVGAKVAVDSFPWYDHTLGWRTLSGETYSKVEELLCANGVRLAVQPAPDRVIAGLSFGVWPSILDVQLTQQQQRQLFYDVFPHHPRYKKKHWDFDTARDATAQRCRTVLNLRNRISHCKPLWPKGWYSSKGSSQHWTDMLQRLKGTRAEIIELLDWMCPGTSNICQNSFGGQWFNQLAAQDAVLHYLQQPLAAGAALAVPAADAATLQAYVARK